MKARPILFSTPMVREVITDRKTQTRRILKQPRRKDGAKLLPELLQRIGVGHACPYGAVGDQLWVRETWGYRGSGWSNSRPNVEDFYVEYQADGSRRTFTHPKGFRQGIPKQPKRPKGQSQEDRDTALDRYWKSWRPSIFLPRWASRITLEITGVRLERLQDITEEDADAEGAAAGNDLPDPYVDSFGTDTPLRAAFAQLWARIHGADSWKANPWVWVIEFKRVETGGAR